MEGFLVVLAFLALFMLGFPVVLAIGIPCVVYIFANDLPIDLVAQRTLYALDSFPLVAVPGVPVRRQPDEQRGHLTVHLCVRRHGRGPHAGRARAGQHLRQPDLCGHVGVGAGRHRRTRAHRDRRDAQERLFGAVRGGGDELVGHRRPDLPAIDSADHLRDGDRRFGDPAPARRHRAGPAVRRHADADDRGGSRIGASIRAPRAGRAVPSCGAISSRRSRRSSRR